MNRRAESVNQTQSVSLGKPRREAALKLSVGDMEVELINRRFEENRKRQGLPSLLLQNSFKVEEEDASHEHHPQEINVVQIDEMMSVDDNIQGSFQRKKLPAEQDEERDKSRKGSVDSRVLPLVTLINSTDDFFTTSTCSGRIILFANESVDETSSSSSTKKIKKSGCKWLMVSHDEVSEETFLKTWRETCSSMKCDVSFKMEPAILHVQCRKLSQAKRLVHAATESGFRNSGMVIGKENRITVAIRSAIGLEVPLSTSFPSEVLSEDFLKHLVAKANEKMLDNWKRMNKLTDEFHKSFINKN